MRFGTGWEPSPPDERDLSAAEVIGAVQAPVPFEAGSGIIEILQQGPYPTCVNNSVLANVREMHRREGVEAPELGSRMFGHVLSKAQHGALSDPERGTFVRAAMKVLSKFGFCRESEYPYASPIDRQPPLSAMRAAFDQRPIEYRQIFETGTARVEAWKRAIAAGYLVSFGTRLPQGFGSLVTSPGMPHPRPGGDLAGGHAMLGCAYRGDAFLTANSWGTGFGDDGYIWMSADWVAWEELKDCWIVTRAPRYS